MFEWLLRFDKLLEFSQGTDRNCLLQKLPELGNIGDFINSFAQVGWNLLEPHR